MDWPHAPLHRLTERGAYMVTAATYKKALRFHGDDWLDYLQQQLFEHVKKWQWQLESWAIFPNHYHFIASPLEDPSSLKTMLGRFHGRTSHALNEKERALGRKVWHQFWDTSLSYETSYLARLNYIHQNPVKHGIVQNASNYRWCSAAWFERNAKPSFVRTVYSMKIDRMNVDDDFELGRG